VDNSYPIKPFLLDLAFPKFCLGCNKEGSYLCQDCAHLLEISENNYCLCQKPIIVPKIFGIEKGKCQNCQEKRLSGLYFAFSYKNKLAQKLIRSFKYEPYIKDLAKTLASLLIEHFVLTGQNTNDIWAPNGIPAVLIPIPLDKDKFKKRGYNQSEELAKELSGVLKISVATNILVKTKVTDPQMELKKEKREKNLENAFAVENFDGIANKKIFLVDDVYTTGSTMNECAKALRQAGAKHVWGIVLAREE
jgi:ComF family protein